MLGHTGELRKNGYTDRDTVRGLTYVGQRNHVLSGVQISPTGRGTFEGICGGKL